MISTLKKPRFWLRAAMVLAPAAVLLAVFACKTPSFPLPPPDRENLQVDLGENPDDGLITLSGTANTVPPEVEVRVINIDKNYGMWFFSDTTGAFVSPDIPAELGERISFYYMEKGDSSYPICFVVQEGTPPPCP